MKIPALNADVLLQIFSLAEDQTKFALMSTCQFLHREGGKQFLKSTGVIIDTEHHVESFHRFMKADGGSRMPSLRRLYLRLEEPTERVALLLNKMLTSLAPVSQLTVLSIRRLEPLLSAYPLLAWTLAQLASLKHVSFSSMRECSLEMVRSMASKLEAADIDLTLSYESLSKNPTDRTPLALLQQSSATLRALTLVGTGSTAGPDACAPQYPLLSVLNLEELFSVPTTWHYVHAFPNLQVLTFDAHDVDDVPELEASDLPALRTRNNAQLREHGCWASLDVLVGPALTLWLLALPCPVTYLRLYVPDMYEREDDEDEDDDVRVPGGLPRVLREVLRPARPAALDITFASQCTMFLDDRVAPALVEACGATLEALSLTLEVTPGVCTGHGTLRDVLDDVMDMLDGNFPALEVLEVFVTFGELHGHVYPEGDPAGVLPIELDAQEVDVHAMCAALRETVPSSKRVRFSLVAVSTLGTVTAEIGSEA